jgi:hypothetical protein
MNTLITSSKNPCPSTKEYKMNPVSRELGKPFVKRPPKAPVLIPGKKLIEYRILAIKGAVATICADMTKLSGGQLTVRDVSVARLGCPGVRVGDIIGFDSSDTGLFKPTITHRASQQHQHPKQLIAPDEK